MMENGGISKMHIVHLYDGHERLLPGEGSVPANVFHTARESADQGHDVTVIERQWRDAPKRETSDGIQFIRFNFGFCSNTSNEKTVQELLSTPAGIIKFLLDRILFSLWAWWVLYRLDFDVMNVHLPFSANVLVTIDSRLRSKTVYSYRSSEHRLNLSDTAKAPESWLKYWSPDLYLMKRVSRTVVVNNSLATTLTNETRLNENDIRVVPSGINVREYEDISVTEEIKEKYGINTSRRYILFAGSIIAHKGIIPLIQAADIVINEFKCEGVQFILAGQVLDHSYHSSVQQTVSDRNLEKFVTYLGFVPHDDLKALYDISDIFVLPSLEEGFGKVLSEAMAMETPVIGTLVGGPKYQVKDGCNGLLVKPNDERALAGAIHELLENKSKREEMGKNGRQFVEEELDWPSIAEQYLDIYDSVIDNQ